MKFTFRRKKKVITALEIGSDWLKIVQVYPFVKDNKISKIIAEKISSLRDEDISKTIGRLSKELQINSNFLILSLPYHLAVIRNLELPSINLAEIKEMVELQLRKQTPFTKEEIIYDYHIIGTNPEGYSRVMLVIVHRNVVERYVKILKEAGLRTDKIALNSEGLPFWLRSAHKAQSTAGPYALIDLKYDNSIFSVISKNELMFCRDLSMEFPKLQDFTDESIKKLIKGINHSIYAYQNEMINEEIVEVIITGAQVFVEGLNEEVLREKLDLFVKVIPQFENIPGIKGALDESKDKGQELSFSCLLGLGLSFSQQKINLIPQHLRIEKGVKGRGKDLYFLGIYLAFILVTASSIFLGRMYNKEQYLARLKKKLAQIQGKVTKLESMMRETEIIKRRVAARNFVMNFLYEIHKDISPDIYLTVISYDGKGSLTLRGISDTMSEIFKFRDALEKSQYFQNVKTKYAVARKEKGKGTTDFEIVCPVDITLKSQLMEEEKK